MNNSEKWDGEGVLEAVRRFQLPAVLMAAAELDLFTHLNGRETSGAELSGKLKCDRRALQTLLDALAAAGLILKKGEHYSLPAGVAEILTDGTPRSVVGMVRHQANCYRRWGELARVVQTGVAAEKRPSVRGGEGDLESFIDAMHNISAPVADDVIRAVQPLRFERLLDIGGGPATWTIAFLRACPGSSAVLFDLPQVIPLAQKRIEQAGLGTRVTLTVGDYLRDALPQACDLAWLSAIVHQNSMEENQDLFQRVHTALIPGGRIAIRDIVMEEDRVNPPAGAFFAVNMLVGTEKGGTFTYSEMAKALEQTGFRDIRLARRDPGMQSVVVAVKG